MLDVGILILPGSMQRKRANQLLSASSKNLLKGYIIRLICAVVLNILEII